MQQMADDLESLRTTLAHAKEIKDDKLYEQTMLEIKITEKYMFEFDSLTAIRRER